MSSIIGSFLQKFVAASVALAMTGLLAWSVIDSTTSGSIGSRWAPKSDLEHESAFRRVRRFRAARRAAEGRGYFCTGRSR
jgi:hypothetical protein